jgi:hypothetical protein
LHGLAKALNRRHGTGFTARVLSSCPPLNGALPTGRPEKRTSNSAACGWWSTSFV